MRLTTTPWGRALLYTSLSSLLVLAAAAPAATNAAPKKLEALFPDEVVAKGKGFEVKQTQLDDAFIAYKTSLATRGQTIPEDKRDELEYRLLDRIIITKILIGRATEEDRKKGKEAADKFLADLKKQYPTGDAFEQQLKATGMRAEDFNSRLLEQSVCEEVMAREVKAKITIPEDQIKKFYDENPEKFDEPEKVRAAHILISTRDKDGQTPLSEEKKKEKEALIKKLKERAEKGEDFGALAKEFTEDPGSKEKGGEYTFGRNEMVKPFEAAAFSLEPGKISDVVETVYGYHIIKLLEKIPARKLELDKVGGDIREHLTRKDYEKQMPVFFAQIKREAGAEVVNARLKAAQPADKK